MKNSFALGGLICLLFSIGAMGSELPCKNLLGQYTDCNGTSSDGNSWQVGEIDLLESQDAPQGLTIVYNATSRGRENSSYIVDGIERKLDPSWADPQDVRRYGAAHCDSSQLVVNLRTVWDESTVKTTEFYSLNSDGQLVLRTQDASNSKTTSETVCKSKK